MSQSKMTLFAGILGLAALATAQDSSISCPGVLDAQDSSTVCCVGGTLSIAPPDISTCPGWPICTGPGTVTPSSTPDSPPITCAAVIDVNDPNYSSLLSSAVASIEASGTSAITTINPTDSPSASPGGSSSDGGSATATSTDESEPSETASASSSASITGSSASSASASASSSSSSSSSSSKSSSSSSSKTASASASTTTHKNVANGMAVSGTALGGMALACAVGAASYLL